ncbi:IPT/TIG domain-containing protein [Rufibacter hautae]|uniref:IPT/TIG domain-containing protein n=1 Tax=Rufibacter hautae TaxID=2595005 RepID=A0A5B6TGE0_9BACT|nr:IPT/TIG domain-containing protein [Rufibacter hautae]KAA3439451.1 hypothetical protein FOA19_01830 [Rufibacter hautae]
MKNFYNIKVLLVVCLFATFGFLQSCSDDEDEVNSGQVELLSFGPTGAKHGEKIKFIGHNLNKVESIEFVGASVAKTQFTSQSSDLIELVIPTAAEEGKITLKVSGGEDIVSKTVLSFEVPVSVASVTANAKPGTNITVTGNYLNWVDSVQFGSLQDSIVTTFVSKSMTELVVRVPLSAKTGSLTLFTGGTEPMVIETEQEININLPAVTALAPSPLKHGENLTITGTDLDLVKEVVFTGVGTAKTATFVSQSPTQIVVMVPDNASAGTLKLVAISGEEVTTTQSLTILLPNITNLTPNPIDPGVNLTITGTNLDLVKSVVFTGGTTVSTFVSRSATQLVVVVPANALKGALTLITNKNYQVSTTPVLNIKGNLPPLAALPFALFDDARRAGWGDWGWGGPSVWNVTDVVRQGTMAAKKTYDGSYDAIRLHGDAGVSMANYTGITFSVFGTPGTGGKNMNLVINQGYSSAYQFKIVEGEWTTYNITKAALGNPATIDDVLFQSAGWTGTVYYDHIGFY